MGFSATFAPAEKSPLGDQAWHTGLAVACVWARAVAMQPCMLWTSLDVVWSLVCVFVASATLAVLVTVGLMAGCAPTDPAVLRAACIDVTDVRTRGP